MADHNSSHYQPGCGVPPYLLCRHDPDPSLYSDGASRIFAPSRSVTSGKDTYSSSMSNTCNTISSASSCSGYTEPYVPLGSLAPSIFECQSSNATRSLNDETNTIGTATWSINDETKTNRSAIRSVNVHTQSNYDYICLTSPDRRRTNEDSILSKSLLSESYAVSSYLIESNNHQMDVCSTYDNDPSAYSDPEQMFTPYLRIFADDEERQQRDKSPEEMHIDDTEEASNIMFKDSPSKPINYDQCCMWGNERVTTCGPSAQHYFDWSPECVTFARLAERDIRSYLKHVRVISKTEEDNIIMNEKNLIANRLSLKNILVDDSMSICPKHRSSFGVDWYDAKSKCNHPNHDSKQHTSASDCRRANLALCSKIEEFPIGGRLCSKHRKMMTMTVDDASISEYSQCSNGTQFDFHDRRETMNRILTEANLSPIRSQTTMVLKNQSRSGLRRLLSKLTRGVRNFQETYAEALAPGQKEELLQLAHLDNGDKIYQTDKQSIDNEMVQNLKEIYDLYVQQKLPFVEQVRLLSLLPRAWKYEKVMEIFVCTRHAIKTAHRMRDDNEYMLNIEKEPIIRQRADPNTIKHFVRWLVESNTLVSGTYGLTTLRMDNGDKFELSKQILQSQKTHAIAAYKKYCDETDFEGLGNRKLFDILNSMKPAQQRVVAGLDEFVVEGVEAWQSLSTIVATLCIPQADRKRLIKQIDMAEQYQKIRHIGHCSDNSDCVTHCTTFGLSDSKCGQQRSNCTRSHTSECADCINIIRTLDEIGQKIEKIVDKEIQRETKFDFENASQHIIEWSRHNLRAARQDDAKNIIISQMGDDEAFCTFDWGQKILPQEHREGQSTYFGKKGMSVLVGSFVWRDSSAPTASTTSSVISPAFCTESYILALTSAAQTDLDSLSAGEIIIKQFKIDHCHVKKLHKRTDNAGNFSSHATPEVEKVICDRIGIQLLTRDYSEVQKGKDICDRVCGVAKARMRSWIATGNDLLNANDIKEGMEYAGGVKNTKVAVAEIVPDTGHLGKTNVPNVSTIRSIHYGSKDMKVFKASNIGDGLSVNYKKIAFESNIRLTSLFTSPIDDEALYSAPKKRDDRKHRDFSMCPVSGCTVTFESSDALDSHIAANLHKIPPEVPRTSNDIARLHLLETVRSTNTKAHKETNTILNAHNASSGDMSRSDYYEYFSSLGWALRTRKHSNPMSDKTKRFIAEIWITSQKTRSKVNADQVLHQMRTNRDKDGDKLFQPHEYATINQIKYRFRKLGAEHDVTAKEELIADLIDDNI